jgi:2-C-methyl-D-erythritol 4-phosphate cytidylyltransferase
VTRVAAIVVAAGSGERLGLGVPKGLVELAGAPLVVHAVRAVGGAASICDVVVVAGADHCEQVSAVLSAAGLDVAGVCAGGATRADSVSAGLAALGRDVEIVAVHDAARPLVTADLVDRCVAALVDPWAAAAPALPVVDTLKLVDPLREAVVRTVDRRHLWAVQTPQVFGRGTLEQAHARLAHAEVTDDLALVEEAGGRVRLIPGERRNFKITFPDDLVVAEALLAAAG